MDEYDEQDEKEIAPTNKFQQIYRRQAKPNYLQNLKWCKQEWSPFNKEGSVYHF